MIIGLAWDLIFKSGQWVCEEGEWVKYGRPRSAKPNFPCALPSGQQINPQENPKGENNAGTPLNLDTGGGILPFGLQSQVPDQNPQTPEANQKIAWDFVVNSPTYKFDGYGIKIEDSKELDCTSCWQFDFSFSSRHSGYGDRTGRVLAQIITPHKVTVTTENGKITKAVIDGKWDEIKQKSVK